MAQDTTKFYDKKKIFWRNDENQELRLSPYDPLPTEFRAVEDPKVHEDSVIYRLITESILCGGEFTNTMPPRNGFNDFFNWYPTEKFKNARDGMSVTWSVFGGPDYAKWFDVRDTVYFASFRFQDIPTISGEIQQDLGLGMKCLYNPVPIQLSSGTVPPNFDPLDNLESLNEILNNNAISTGGDTNMPKRQREGIQYNFGHCIIPVSLPPYAMREGDIFRVSSARKREELTKSIQRFLQTHARWEDGYRPPITQAYEITDIAAFLTEHKRTFGNRNFFNDFPQFRADFEATAFLIPNSLIHGTESSISQDVQNEYYLFFKRLGIGISVFETKNNREFRELLSENDKKFFPMEIEGNQIILGSTTTERERPPKWTSQRMVAEIAFGNMDDEEQKYKLVKALCQHPGITRDQLRDILIPLPMNIDREWKNITWIFDRKMTHFTTNFIVVANGIQKQGNGIKEPEGNPNINPYERERIQQIDDIIGQFFRNNQDDISKEEIIRSIHRDDLNDWVSIQKKDFRRYRKLARTLMTKKIILNYRNNEGYYLNLENNMSQILQDYFKIDETHVEAVSSSDSHTVASAEKEHNGAMGSDDECWGSETVNYEDFDADLEFLQQELDEVDWELYDIIDTYGPISSEEIYAIFCERWKQKYPDIE